LPRTEIMGQQVKPKDALVEIMVTLQSDCVTVLQLSRLVNDLQTQADEGSKTAIEILDIIMNFHRLLTVVKSRC